MIMAKIQTLKDRNTDATIYPETCARAVYFSDGGTVEDKVSRLETEKRSNIFAEEPLTPGNFPGMDTYTREQLKMDLFIDLWNTAWKIGGRVYGRYDPDNAPDAEHPFMGNDIWMTYGEAEEVMRMPRIMINQESESVMFSPARTLVPCIGNFSANLRNFCFGCLNLETVRVVDYYIVSNGLDPDTRPVAITSTRDAFCQCPGLREVRGILKLSPSDALGKHFYSGFSQTRKLRRLWLHSVCLDMSLAPLGELELECWAYMVEHAANTKAITITVHPDVYAKLTDESNAEWHKVLLDAAGKQITFVTT